MKTKIKKYTEKFEEVYNDGNKQIFIRNFGKVMPNQTDVNLLYIAEIYDLDGAGAMHPEEIDTLSKSRGYVQLSFSLLPEEQFISKKHKLSANDSGYSISNNTLVNIHEYMGGLYFEPDYEGEVWFKSNQKAKDYLMTKKLNDTINSLGILSGFTMDKYYNRAGETNWIRLDKIMNEK